MTGWLISYATRTPQPDPAIDPDGWTHIVSTPTYLTEHLASGVFGTVLVILGTVALGSYLSSTRAARMALAGMVAAVTGTDPVRNSGRCRPLPRRRSVPRI
jgi:hypothetical protein